MKSEHNSFFRTTVSSHHGNTAYRSKNNDSLRNSVERATELVCACDQDLHQKQTRRKCRRPASMQTLTWDVGDALSKQLMEAHAGRK